MIRTAAAVVMLSFAVTPVLAAEARDGASSVQATATSDGRSDTPVGVDATTARRVQGASPADNRPAALTALYISYAALQAYDAHSTLSGLKQGAREANPVAGAIVGSSATFWTVKAATTGAAILIAEKMWKKNKVAAIATMAVANSVSAIVAARNASVLKEIR